MKRNLLSTLSSVTAATLLICSAFTANASSYSVDDESIIKISNSPGSIVGQGMFNGIMIETDGTELTEEMVSSLGGFASLMTWEDYTAFQFNFKNVTDITPEGTAYMVELDTSDAEALSEIGRNLMLREEIIKNVYIVDYTTYVYLVPVCGVYLELANPETAFDASTVPELEGYEITQKSGGALLWCTPPEEELLSRSESTLYEQYEYYRDLGENLLANYEDLFVSAKVELALLEDADSYNNIGTSTSIWQTAGDPNADGAVDAKDAASILQTAAENGTGAGIAATSATDVNADGEVNAKDAAAVLVYAAEEGAGKTPDWVEILRR